MYTINQCMPVNSVILTNTKPNLANLNESPANSQPNLVFFGSHSLTSASKATTSTSMQRRKGYIRSTESSVMLHLYTICAALGGKWSDDEEFLGVSGLHLVQLRLPEVNDFRENGL